MKLAVLNKSGKETGRSVTLSEAIYSIEPNDHAIYLDSKLYLANQRQGTHKAKEKSELSGSTRKLKKQKGTGTARAGSIKSPLFVGGARVFGPKPRDYSFKLNKKVKALARKSALTYKAKENAILVLEALSLNAPKTKDVVALLSALNSEVKKSLIVLPELDNNLYLSARNIPNAKVVVASELNTYDILNSKQLILIEGSLSKIEEILN